MISTEQTERLQERAASAVPRGVGQMTPLVIESGEGSLVKDVDGRSYIDFAGGIGALNLGHRHPAVMRRVREQLDRLHHVAIGVSQTREYIEVAERLCQIAPGTGAKKAVLLNSGAEAVENAVKIARAATGRPGLVAFDLGFHGRTLLTMSLSGKYHPNKEGFEPFIPVHRLPYPNPYRCPYGIAGCAACPDHWEQALERLLTEETDPRTIAAVIVEPVAGEGGFVVPPKDFLARLHAACRRHGILLIVDEIQTGFGRTGTLFASESAGVEPDLMTVGKSLAAGFPLTAVIGRADVMDAPEPGTLGGTYTGNPVACAAALGVLDTFRDEDILGRARHVGDVLGEALRQWRSEYEIVGDSRRLGAMGAVEIVRDRATREPSPAEAKEALHYAHDHGLLLIKAGAHDNVLRTLMPLTIPDDQLREGLRIFGDALGYVSERRTAIG
ncbi:MAG: 4-aminobutyrate--2-oxoglutarate transaminase [Candidatus Dormibacteraceae bacterium]